MRGLQNKTVVVTGGGGGIGRAVARRFAEAGSKVVIFDVSGEAARNTLKALVSRQSEHLSLEVDITNEASVRKAVVTTIQRYGSIDNLVNGAGWDKFGAFLNGDSELWTKLIAVNLIGAIHMHKEILPGMVAQQSGRVINIASDAARVGSSGEAVYSACKGGLISLSKTLAREHARDGVTVNVVCPGPTETPLLESVLNDAGNPKKLGEAYRRAIPMGRLGRPEDIAGTVAFLASDEASYLTGQVISVSGGLTMAG